jgi:hypothetical protein
MSGNRGNHGGNKLFVLEFVKMLWFRRVTGKIYYNINMTEKKLIFYSPNDSPVVISIEPKQRYWLHSQTV